MEFRSYRPEFRDEALNTQISLQRNLEVDEIFREIFEFYNNTEPTNSMYIPKRRTPKQLGKIVYYLNQVLNDNVNQDTDFKTLQRIITVRHGLLQR